MLSFRLLLSLALCVLLLPACKTTVVPSSRSTVATPPKPDIVWPKVYEDAIQDALNPKPSEVVHNLTAIVPSNPDLIWKTFNDTAYVLMSSLVGDTSWYAGMTGKPYNTSTHYIWVTASPQLQKRCSDPAFGPNNLIARLRQLIGLTPFQEIGGIVEFFVRPDQLFRPAPDNEITDTTAGLQLPDKVEPWYREWFNQLRAGQYFQSKRPEHSAYPWTQLGYTYDWGNSKDHQGLSEFVIKAGSRVRIHRITTVEGYCGRK